MVINLEQKEIHFDLRFILTYNIYIHATSKMKMHLLAVFLLLQNALMFCSPDIMLPP